MAKNKVAILSTRWLDPWYTNPAADIGIIIENRPFVTITPIDTAELKEELQSLMLQQAITAVFTSSNAVDAVAKHIADKQPEWKIYCLQGATLKAVTSQFEKAVIADVATDAQSLAQQIISEGVTHNLVFFSGNISLPTLPQILTGAGKQLRQIVVYNTQLTPVEIDKQYDGILFFSPSAVKAFFTCNTVHSSVVFFAIGSTTAAALKAYSNPVVVSPVASKQSMINNVIKYYKK